MWSYDKKLEYPVKIARANPALAKVIVSQLGGPHGELGAAVRYLSQRFTAPSNEVIALLTDIGTEALKMRRFIHIIYVNYNRKKQDPQNAGLSL